MPEPERRQKPRAKIARPIRVRPSEARDDHFDDVTASVNASRSGVFFHSRQDKYYKGMRVFVTYPYASPGDPMNMEYVGEVVRVEPLGDGKFGVAVHFVMSVNYGSAVPQPKPTPF
ncbi:MAG TPA: PilZ domain-containing protein [Methylomirabilota bacterium]|nr:PilZ domain-containing protein [Methylomirabilota bacterium]